jgi:hypothetical protein
LETSISLTKVLEDVLKVVYPDFHHIATPSPDKGRFLILSVKAGLGRQGGIVDKEDLIQKMVC